MSLSVQEQVEALRAWNTRLRSALTDTRPPEDWSWRPRYEQQASNTPAPLVRIPPGGLLWEDLEREAFTEALRMGNGEQKAAGELLGLSGRMVHYHLKRLGLWKGKADEHPSV